jgi:hypothetical protein
MLSSHELFGFMSPALAADILEFAFTAEKDLYRATLQSVAQARKLRPVFLERQARTERHPTMIAALSRPNQELAAANLIRGWLMKKHTALLIDFLDALGVTHQQGAVEDLPPAMDDAKLRSAIDALLAKHPPEVVAIYLNAFSAMNDSGWTNLDALLKSDSRLQLGG